MEKVDAAIREKSLVKLVLSNRRDSTAELQRIIVAPAEIRKTLMLKFVLRYPTQDITKNFAPPEGIGQVRIALEKDFLNADLFTTVETVRLFDTGQGRFKMRTGRPEALAAPAPGHDREKERLIRKENNPWLGSVSV